MIPDPEDRKPAGFTDEQWTADRALARGGTHRDVAEVVGCSRGTISGWIRSWRGCYGDDLFRAQARRNTRSQVAERAPRLDHRLALEWAAFRPATATDAATVGGLAATVVEELLAGLLEDPERIAGLSINDLRHLSRVAADQWAAADRLAGIPHPDRIAMKN